MSVFLPDVVRDDDGGRTAIASRPTRWMVVDGDIRLTARRPSPEQAYSDGGSPTDVNRKAKLLGRKRTSAISETRGDAVKAVGSAEPAVSDRSRVAEARRLGA